MMSRFLQLSGLALLVSTSCFLLMSPTATAADELTIAPDSVDFGEITSGLSGAWNLTVTNAGPSSIQLGDIGFEGDVDPFSLDDGGCLDVLELPSGQSCDLHVVFRAPMVTADFETIVFVEGSGVDDAVASLTASSFLEGYLTADPSVLDVGPTPMGTTSTPRSVVVRNAGDSPVNISAVGIYGPASIVPFRVAANDCVGVLGPREDCLVSVVFTPNAFLGLGDQHAPLFVTVPGEWGLLIPLNGVAAAPTQPIGPTLGAEVKPPAVSENAVSKGLKIALADLADAVPALVRGGPTRLRSLPRFAAPAAGRLRLALFGRKDGRRLRIGAGALTFDRPKTGRLRFQLNKRGVALLRRPRRARIKVVLEFEPHSQAAFRHGRGFVVKAPLVKPKRN